MKPRPTFPFRHLLLATAATFAVTGAAAQDRSGTSGDATKGGGPGTVTGTTGTGTGAAATQPGMSRDTANAGKSNVSRGDRQFLQDAMKSGMAEVELARIAKERASNAQVRAFAERMEADHSKSNQEITALANAKFVAADGKPGMGERRHADRLAKLNGAEFDRAYMQHMTEAHRDTVQKFQKAAGDAEDADVKALAAKTLPTLRGHLESAQSIAQATRSESAKR